MNALTRIQFNLREASTKRGLAMFVAGSVALYHLLWGTGDGPDLDAVLARADFWLGVGAQLSGLIGMFFADEPNTVRIELPPTTPPSPLAGDTAQPPSPLAGDTAQPPSPLAGEGRGGGAVTPLPPRRLPGVTVDVPPGHRIAPDLDERRAPSGFNDR
jgi:hypothetical protein